MNLSRMTFLTVALLLPAGSGCDRSPEQAHEQASRAQQSANDKAAAAREDLHRTTSDIENKAHAQIDQAQREANDKVAKLQASANEELRAANLDMRRAQDEFRAWCQGQAAEVANLLDQTRTGAEKLGPEARAEFDRRLHEIELRRDEVRAQVDAIDRQTAADWADFKSRVQTRFEELKSGIKNLRSSETARALR